MSCYFYIDYFYGEIPMSELLELKLPDSFSLESYCSYLKAFGDASHAALGPYSEKVKERLPSAEAGEILRLEVLAEIHIVQKEFSKAALALSNALESQLAKTFDLVSAGAWISAIPDLGPDRESMLTTLRDNNFQNLLRVFSLTAT